MALKLRFLSFLSMPDDMVARARKTNQMLKRASTGCGGRYIYYGPYQDVKRSNNLSH